MVGADGRAIWFRESLAVEADAEGRPRVIRGCLWEIGRRKKVERQLYTDRRKLAEHLADVRHLYLLGGHLLTTLDLAPVLEEILAAVTSIQGAEMGRSGCWIATAASWRPWSAWACRRTTWSGSAACRSASGPAAGPSSGAGR